MKRKSQTIRTQLLTCVALVTGSSLLPTLALAQQEANQGSGQESGQADDSDGSTIIVEGIRSSLADGIATKRNADQISDVIVAEDVDKLPDSNVAEALQRVTGVQINRTLGEGSEIAVRGFSQNRIEINGQTQSGSGSTGSVSFDALPSDAFGKLEVIKSPTADMVEGSLGATIRLTTRKPLDQRGLILSGRLQDQYSERSETHTPNLAAFVSNKWDVSGLGRIGVSLNVSYFERRLREDSFLVRGWEPVNNFGIDVDGDGISNEPIERDDDGVITDLQDGVYVPLQLVVQAQEQNRDRLSLTTALQWQPSNSLEFYFDGTYTEQDRNDRRRNLAYLTGPLTQNDGVNGGNRVRGGDFQVNDLLTISNNSTLQSGILGEVRANGSAGRAPNAFARVDSNPLKQQVYTYQVGSIWNANDRLTVEAKYAHNYGEESGVAYFLPSQLNFNDRPFLYVDFTTGNDLPTLTALLRQDVNGGAPTTLEDAIAADLTTLPSWSVANLTYQDRTETFSEDAFHLDFDWELDAGILRSVEFGGRYAKRNGTRERFDTVDRAGDADGVFQGLTLDQLEALIPGSTGTVPYNNLLSGASGRDLVTLDWRGLNATYVEQNFDSFIAANMVTLNLNDGFGYDVDEETIGGYGKLNFESDAGLFGIPFSGNIGARYVRTNIDALGTLNDQTTIVPFRQTSSYDNFLPSANITFLVSDKFFVRLAASRAMTRPNLTRIAPATIVRFFSDQGEAGNPDLRPEVVNALDLSLEYYFSKDSLLSLALFKKHFTNRIQTGFIQQCFALPPGELEETPGDDGCVEGEDNINLRTEVNAGEANVNGFEVSFQQAFTFLPSPLDGFGAILNYTFVDSDSETLSPAGFFLPQEDLSRHSYNLVGYYEKYGFSARLAYTWREAFFDQIEQTNFAGFSDDYGQLDGSISYAFTKRFSVSIEALNLNKASQTRFQEVEDRLLAYQAADRRFLIGFRGRI